MDWVKVPAGSVREEPSGIVVLRIDDDIRIDTDTARDLVAALDAFIPTPAPFLVDLSGVIWAEKEARDVIAASHYATARAILVRGSASGVVAQLFQHLHHPDVVTRTFTNEDDAREWLETFLT